MQSTGVAPLIIVVDDNPGQRYATRRMLEKAGFRTKECSTGQEALASAAENPDLIILDVKLPDIDGFEVCRRLKADPAAASIPVLHLSALVISTDAKVTGLEAGADGYLTQPVEPDELVATIRTLLRARAAEQKLRFSEHRYRSMFEHLPLPCWLLHGSSGNVLAVNNAALNRYSYSPEEAAALGSEEIIASGGLKSVVSAVEKNGGMFTQYARHRDRNRHPFDVEVTWVSVEIDGAPALLGIVYDLSERRAASEAMRKAQLRRMMLRRAIVAQEQERRRVARELHDEAGQSLTSLLVGLQTLQSAKSLAQAKATAKELREIIASSLDGIGRLARGLHPIALEDLGLGAALERLATEFCAAHGIELELSETLGKLDFLDRDASLVLYRIAQEALTNIGKHAQAKRVSISFVISDVLRFSIKDDGVGYRATEKTDGRHLGIQSMRERAAMLGGRLGVTSRAGGGTAVIVTIPIAEQEQQQAQSA